MDSGTYFVYVTAGDPEEARRIARTVVEERLAACANILNPIESVFWWEGEVQQDSETALILKTSAERADDLTRRIKSLHSYECPCIVFLPIEKGFPDYLTWISDSCKPR
jgi:periplasmic divalent cation tolerance protein